MPRRSSGQRGRRYSWQGWRCRTCLIDFTVTSGTWLHGSKIPLHVWLAFAEAVAAAPMGYAYLAQELGVSKPTARRMIRVLASASSLEPGLVSPMAGDAADVMRKLLAS